MTGTLDLLGEYIFYIWLVPAVGMWCYSLLVAIYQYTVKGHKMDYVDQPGWWLIVLPFLCCIWLYFAYVHVTDKLGDKSAKD